MLIVYTSNSIYRNIKKLIQMQRLMHQNMYHSIIYIRILETYMFNRGIIQ